MFLKTILISSYYIIISDEKVFFNSGNFRHKEPKNLNLHVVTHSYYQRRHTMFSGIGSYQ
jgi:hypothetical protein